MALIKEYFELTQKYKNDYGNNTILLMEVGSFYEVYGLINKNTNKIIGSSIEDFSQICELNVVEKKATLDKQEVVMAGFKNIMIEKHVKKIQEAGFTAVVYSQDEAAKNTTRSLSGIFSPGTYFSNESTNLTNNLICIWIDLIVNKVFMKGKYIVVGISNIDIYTGKTNVFQFKEIYINNPTTYDELERYISIYNPSEAILISNLPNKEVDDVISFIGLNCSLIHKINISDEINNSQNRFYVSAKNCEKQPYQKEILNKFYKINNVDDFMQNFYENNVATQSFCFLLDFVYQHNQHLVNKISEPVFENSSNRLILANHSLKQLNIVDDTNYKGKYSSVLKMLNGCLTPMGKRKFTHNFLHPITDKNILQNEYDITEYLLINYEKYIHFLNNHLSSIKDISKFERQVIIKKISPKAFYVLYNNLVTIKNIYSKISEDQTIYKYLLDTDNKIKNVPLFCDNVLNFIDQNINIQIAQDIDNLQLFETNFIKKSVDTTLDEQINILSVSESKLEAIKNYLNSIIPDKGKIAEFIKVYETEKNNFSLICTSRRCKLLEGVLSDTPKTITLSYNENNENNENNESNLKKTFNYTISKKHFEYKTQTTSNNSISDAEINKICKNISSIKTTLKDTIANVFNSFVEKFESYQSQIEIIINFITTIDILYAKSSIARKYNYCKPVIAEADKSFINAKHLRHCLIEQLQNNELYVTNDVIIGNCVVDGILLYGTNAVGKTSFIRALGISLIMAQAGLYVPCSEFIYKPYNYIFTRILGNDNLFKGLSTFAVEMSELRTILRLANENSLILGDELCSGTENTSAVSIFVAGIQKLYSLRSSFIFATHLHEIVNFSEINELSSVVLKHMEVIYDKERDLLVYDRKIKDGPGTSMYGLEVCKSLNLPEDFLNMAYSIRDKYNPQFKSILSLKPSHYNSKKIMGMCELCEKNMGSEVHHLQHQSDADNNNIIRNDNGTIFHKNNLANLISVCKECHDKFHKTDKKHKKVKSIKKDKSAKEYILSEV
jgi:DNA mismatch repair protein MutS